MEERTFVSLLALLRAAAPAWPVSRFAGGFSAEPPAALEKEEVVWVWKPTVAG